MCKAGSNRAQWSLVPNFCSCSTRKSYFFHTNSYTGHSRFYSFRALGAIQFSLEHSLDVKNILHTARISWSQCMLHMHVLLHHDRMPLWSLGNRVENVNFYLRLDWGMSKVSENQKHTLYQVKYLHTTKDCHSF